jgi:hypothetical protein
MNSFGNSVDNALSKTPKGEKQRNKVQEKNRCKWEIMRKLSFLMGEGG